MAFRQQGQQAYAYQPDPVDDYYSQQPSYAQQPAHGQYARQPSPHDYAQQPSSHGHMGYAESDYPENLSLHSNQSVALDRTVADRSARAPSCISLSPTTRPCPCPRPRPME